MNISKWAQLPITVAALLTAGALTLAGCSANGGGNNEIAESGTTASSDEALAQGGEITIWSWEGTLKDVVADFEADNPGVKVNLVNAGSGNDHYAALQNAIAAGSGIPDIAQVEYFAIPQFALPGSLVDLNQFGAADLDGKFSPGPWNSVQFGEGIYGMPMDSGPIALFYNATLFEENGVEVPTTWEEFVEAGRALKKSNAKAYIMTDTGNAGVTQALIWQAGGRPFQVEGTDVSINFDEAGVHKYTDMWQTLIDEDLLAPFSLWSDEWYQGLADGSIATLVAGAWMPANLESGVPTGSGDWRVAMIPQWEADQRTSAENGGSSLAIMEGTPNAELAYAFLEYANLGGGVKTRVELGAFPATTAELNSEEFKNREFEYFGGQKANEIFVDSANAVAEGWSFLPFQVYANSVFGDTVGQAYVGKTTLQQGLEDWQSLLTQYGADQGFAMK
ncbi:extracellular solute-binding protein [Actinomycetaceae bacterium WB03_NA08]|uniref:Extracellular solute-binding protein n=1 Tax=Scrofimicrobium canadense TaxID=2652290 RepID=A0A6N7W869_9ACTO|nr:extracellular solute-binding protein [Scrofimicrobium canadense]MSS84632.1 extracellular solute-binding protein [Scrofimicrobium canadense]